MKHVLLVEDNEMNRDMLSRRLERRGFRVSLAVDGEDALVKVEAERPDIILMDMSLPVLDGWEATRRLKAQGATSSIPVIALTAHALAADEAQAREAGCDDFDVKPVDLQRLLGKMQVLVRRLAVVSFPFSSMDLARIRHDLRTPINHILGYCELLLEEDTLPGELRGDLQRIHASGRHLLLLISEHFDSECSASSPPPASAIHHQLRTPVNQILGYTELLQESARDSQLPELLPDLEKIHRAATQWWHLMEALLLPNRPGEDSPPAPETAARLSYLAQGISYTVSSAALPPTAEAPAVVLVADDDATNREMLARRLSRQGHRILEASTGVEALETLRAEPVDLLLLDMVMPLMDGFQLLATLKQDPALREIPVIMISALDDEKGIARCIELGAEDYLAKPFNATILGARIGASLERKRLREREALHLRDLEEERARSERLLLNVLPAPIAERLKREEGILADHFPEATVLFADLVGFTPLADAMPPVELVQWLDEIFSSFDLLAAAWGMEKIKTIGDAYMAACGLPVPRPGHAEAAAEFALALRIEIDRFNRDRATTLSLRVGIDTGPVVAGVIGRHRFIYDLWGDPVNTASRMESHGLPGTIQITERVRQALGPRYAVEARGLIDVKGKGRMRTYLLHGRA